MYEVYESIKSDLGKAPVTKKGSVKILRQGLASSFRDLMYNKYWEILESHPEIRKIILKKLEEFTPLVGDEVYIEYLEDPEGLHEKSTKKPRRIISGKRPSHPPDRPHETSEQRQRRISNKHKQVLKERGIPEKSPGGLDGRRRGRGHASDEGGAGGRNDPDESHLQNRGHAYKDAHPVRGRDGEGIHRQLQIRDCGL